MEENGRLGVLMVVTVGPSCDVDRKWPNISGMNMHFNLLFVTSNTVLLVWYAIIYPNRLEIWLMLG